MLNIISLGNIQLALYQLAPVDLVLNTLSNDLGRIHNILENVFMDGCESAVSWSLLLGIASTISLGLVNNASESKNENLSTTKLLFQFTNQTVIQLVVSAELAYRDIDNNGFFMTNFKFLKNKEKICIP